MVVYMKGDGSVKGCFKPMGLFKSIFLKLKGGLYEQKFVIIHERSVS